MLQLESELEAIERVMRKVDLANEPNSNNNINTRNITLTSVGSIESNIFLGPASTDRNHRAAAMVELIQQFVDISATIERLSSKPLNLAPVDFPSTEFPRELSDRLDKASRFDKCVHALDVKDQLLWEVMCERDQMKGLLGQEKDLCQKYASELADWAELAQGLAAQVTELKVYKKAVEERNDELIQLLHDNNILYIDDDVDDDDEFQE